MKKQKPTARDLARTFRVPSGIFLANELDSWDSLGMNGDTSRPEDRAKPITKKEFVEIFSAVRRAQLKEAYKGDPHGPACFAASMVDALNRAEKLWRKHRRTLVTMTAAEFKADLERRTK